MHGASERHASLGCLDLTFVINYRVLTRIFKDKELKDISNPNLLSLKEKILMYSFRTKYMKGKTNCVPDALFRYLLL